MLLQDHPSNSTQASTSPAKLIVTKNFHPANSSTHNLKNNHHGSTSTDHEHAYDHLHPAARHKTFLAGLVNACVLLPTITALFTIFCYFLLPTIPLIPENHLSVLVAGVLTASLATFLVALFRRSAATYQEGNSQSFSNSEMCLNRLETRLAVLKQINGTSPGDDTPEDKLLREVGIEEAESALRKAKHICKTCNGYQWITGAGYAHLQQALYDVEEALIKIEPISMLISEAKHDQAALQDANMSNNKQLSDELQQAIEDLKAHYAPPKQKKM